jgi:cytochrome bd-type quinol oxidase subunit 2
MNVKKGLENRIRGWFPKEPKLHGKYTSDSSYNENTQPQTNSSLTRTFAKKTAIPFLAGYITVIFSLLYLAQNHLINSATYSSGIMCSFLLPIYYSIAFHVYVRKRTHLDNTVDKIALPIVAVSAIAVTALLYLVVNNLIARNTLPVGIIFMMLVLILYNAAMDLYPRKTRKPENQTVPLPSPPSH